MRVDLIALEGEGFAEIVPRWRDIAAAGRYAAPFFQPEWFSAFNGAFVGHGAAQLFTVWSGSTLKGVAPLHKTGEFFGGIPARTLRSLSGIHSCRYDLIHDGSDQQQVVEALWESLCKDQRWDVIEAEDVPHGGAFYALQECARAAGFPVGTWSTRKTPILPLPAPNQDPFSNCPQTFKSLRSRLKSKLRRLEEAQQGKVSFEVEQHGTPELFERFVRLESSGWKGSKGSAITQRAEVSRFYKRIVEYLNDAGILRYYMLNAGGKTIAMHLGALMNGVYYTPKVAYDESYAVFSPGQLLNQFAIKDLSRNGVQTYDFLGPRAMYKCVWAPEVREHSSCYIFRPSLKGRFLHALTMRAAGYMRRVRYRIKGDPQDIRWGQKTV
jgi:CelD/BcsL family acetyltransferase involved in cellulose biosynthesis